MSFTRKIIYYLVHTLKISNKEAQMLLSLGKIEINGKVIETNCLLLNESEIKVNNEILREKTTFVYLKFYKPKDYESSLNTKIPNNLASFFTEFKNLAIAGRLDKQSEGLLLLSNDGKWVEKICHPNFEKEKEYEVTLNKTPDSDFLKAFESGVTISGYTTKPCVCKIIEAKSILIILKEGKNRQIRKMCKSLGYEVVSLKRTRIDQITLEPLKATQFTYFTHNQ